MRHLPALLLAALPLPGCVPPTPQPEVPTLSAASELALGPGDLFEVFVFGEQDLSGTYRVGADGTIDYPLIGQIRVDEMQPHAAAMYIAKRLSEKYLRHPQVRILVRDQQSKKIIVTGQVQKPGTFPYTSNMTIVEAITLAGGFTPIASKNRTTITRIENGQKSSLEIAVSAIAEGKAQNVAVRPGDIISVPERIF